MAAPSPKRAHSARADLRSVNEKPEKAEGQAPPEPGSPSGGRGALDDLLSGKATAAHRAPKKGRRKVIPAEPLPDRLAELADILASGRRVEKEVQFKLGYAEEKVREHCLRRFCEKFAESGHWPESTSFIGKVSRFTYIPTARIAMTPEKAAALRELGIPVDDYSRLRGIRINYAAIREHKLEERLREALGRLGLPEEILREVFEPQLELKENFAEHLSVIVERTLKEGEKLADKLFEVARTLSPASQIRNAETPKLTAAECFQKVLSARIEPESGDGEAGEEDWDLDHAAG